MWWGLAQVGVISLAAWLAWQPGRRGAYECFSYTSILAQLVISAASGNRLPGVCQWLQLLSLLETTEKRCTATISAELSSGSRATPPLEKRSLFVISSKGTGFLSGYTQKASWSPFFALFSRIEFLRATIRLSIPSRSFSTTLNLSLSQLRPRTASLQLCPSPS